MTEQTQLPTNPFALPLGLCNPLWPAYGLMMGASLHWWALSRMARFASPIWAFETKPKTVETVQAPVAEATPVAQAEVHVEAAPLAEPELATTVEAAFAPELETFMAPDVAPEPQPEPAPTVDAAFAPELETFVALESQAEPTSVPEATMASEPPVSPKPAIAPKPTLGPGDVDELTLIRGIGPRVADALVERGVTTFANSRVDREGHASLRRGDEAARPVQALRLPRPGQGASLAGLIGVSSRLQKRRRDGQDTLLRPRSG